MLYPNTDYFQHLEFCNTVDEYLKNNWRKLSRIYSYGRYARGLYYLASKRNSVDILKPKCLRNKIYLPGGMIGSYASTKESNETISSNKYYMLNMRAFSRDYKNDNEYKIQKRLLSHLDCNFKNAGRPELIFLVDSLFTERIANQYLENGYSYIFITNTVYQGKNPTGTTILIKGVLTTDRLASLRLLPYSRGYVNYELFENGHENFKDISMYSSVFIHDQDNQYVGGFHQPASSSEAERSEENLIQIQKFEDNNIELKLLMMDSNKYGVNTARYTNKSRFKKLTFNHPIGDFIPALIARFKGKSVNHKEINSCRALIKSHFKDYNLIFPLNNDKRAKTFHGQHFSIPELTFAAMVDYCLDLSIVNSTRYKWFIRTVKPNTNSNPLYFTDHSGILLECLDKK